jgi:hypothetical protein
MWQTDWTSNIFGSELCVPESHQVWLNATENYMTPMSQASADRTWVKPQVRLLDEKIRLQARKLSLIWKWGMAGVFGDPCYPPAAEVTVWGVQRFRNLQLYSDFTSHQYWWCRRCMPGHHQSCSGLRADPSEVRTIMLDDDEIIRVLTSGTTLWFW